jgi:hypothetical protein
MNVPPGFAHVAKAVDVSIFVMVKVASTFTAFGSEEKRK